MEAETYRKITRRILPLLFLGYLFAFLDRINVGYAQLQMKSALGFSDATYGLGAGIFFLSYLLFEIPSNLLLERIGARLTLLRIMVLWGLTSAGTMFVATPGQFYMARFLLGLFEGGFFPGIILYLTYWYPSSRRAAVTGQFMFAVPVAGMVGGPLSAWILSSLDKVAGLDGWRWIFLIEGLPTVVLGIVCYFTLRDEPSQATWLTDSEKALVQRLLSSDGSGHRRGRDGWGFPLYEVLRDAQVWVLVFIYFACAVASYSFTFWLPAMIKGFGIENIAQIGWWSALPYAFGGAGVLLITRSSDRRRERRWHVGGSLIAAALLLVATVIRPQSQLVDLAILCVCAFFLLGAAIAYWSLPPTYLDSKAAPGGIALISSVGVTGGFVGPTIFGFTKDATGDFAAGIYVVAAIMIAGGVATILALAKGATRVGAAAVCVVLLALCGLPTRSEGHGVRPAPPTCLQLKGVRVPATRIGLPTSGAVVTSATLIPASTLLPEYCKVEGRVEPQDPRVPTINFEIDLPSAWNHKLVMLGGGGYDGEIPATAGNVPAGPADRPFPLARGYAVIGSDSGHQANEPGLPGLMDASFALNAESLQNYAGNAIKKSHDVAVYLLQARYPANPLANGPSGPQKAYFVGGSTGGREALVAVLRWPQDWDGAISLYPAWNAIALDLQVGRVARALAQPGGYLTQGKRELLYKATLEACDELDGAADGIVSNVAACNARFDPATATYKSRPLRCPGGADEGDSCLSDRQIATLRTYATPIVFQSPLASGETQYPGYNIYGADLGRPGTHWLQSIVTSLALGTDPPATPAPAHASSLNLFWDHWIRYFVAQDPNYNALTVDPQNLGTLQARVNALSSLLDVNQTDFAAFASRGGKLLIAHGTADVLVSTRATEQYFDRLQAAMGAAKVRDFARFYEIPGYGHAASTVFNAAWDSLTTLENWVEHHATPADQVVTDTVGSPGRQRPLCEYPSWPRYRGAGDINAASSFSCTTH
jgi:D-galactonate transporter